MQELSYGFSILRLRSFFFFVLEKYKTKKMKMVDFLVWHLKTIIGPTA